MGQYGANHYSNSNLSSVPKHPLKAHSPTLRDDHCILQAAALFLTLKTPTVNHESISAIVLLALNLRSPSSTPGRVWYGTGLTHVCQRNQQNHSAGKKYTNIEFPTSPVYGHYIISSWSNDGLVTTFWKSGLYNSNLSKYFTCFKRYGEQVRQESFLLPRSPW